jgi:hypothetical protein
MKVKEAVEQKIIQRRHQENKTDQHREMLPFDIEEPRFAKQQIKDQQEKQGFPDDYGYRMQYSFQREEKRGEGYPNSVKHPVKNDSEQKAAVIKFFFDSGVHIFHNLMWTPDLSLFTLPPRKMRSPETPSEDNNAAKLQHYLQ